MGRFTLDIKKSIFIIDGVKHSLFDLPQFTTRLINSLEKEKTPASMEVEKEKRISQLSINITNSQDLIRDLIANFNSVGIYLN